MLTKITNIFKKKEEIILQKENSEKYINTKIYKTELTQECIDIEKKLAHLLILDIVFCNNGWWYKSDGIEWRDDAISFHVNCNDVFAWGCADAEDLLYSEVSELYEFVKKDHDYGSWIWCIQKRQKRPQKPVEDMLVKNGYNINELLKDLK